MENKLGMFELPVKLEPGVWAVLLRRHHLGPAMASDGIDRAEVVVCFLSFGVLMLCSARTAAAGMWCALSGPPAVAWSVGCGAAVGDLVITDCKIQFGFAMEEMQRASCPRQKGGSIMSP